MKIAVPTTSNNLVDSHFGHCEFFTVFTIENNKVAAADKVTSNEGCVCKSSIVPTLSNMGVSLMLAGNIGQGAVNVLDMNGIDVIRGCNGDVTKIVEEYLAGELIDSGEMCAHHEHHHGMN